MSDNAGIRAIAHILRRAAQGRPITVDGIAQESAVSRSTAFVVVRRLENARFVRRDREGLLEIGPAATALGFARFGLSGLQGPAEAVLEWLRSQMGGSAALGAIDENGSLVLLSVAGDRQQVECEDCLDEPVHDLSGRTVAMLKLSLPVGRSSSDTDHATLCMQKAAVTLTNSLGTREISRE